MSMTEERVRAALESYVEPYLQQTLSEAGALLALEIQGKQVLVRLELGFPTVGYAHTLQAALQQHLAAADLRVDLTLELTSRIVPHAVQRHLKPISRVKNIVAVASGKGGVGKST